MRVRAVFVGAEPDKARVASPTFLVVDEITIPFCYRKEE